MKIRFEIGINQMNQNLLKMRDSGSSGDELVKEPVKLERQQILGKTCLVIPIWQ